MDDSKKTFLVTGASGSVGRGLTELLTESGHRVIGTHTKGYEEIDGIDYLEFSHVGDIYGMEEYFLTEKINLDGVVLAHGINRDGPIEDSTDECYFEDPLYINYLMSANLIRDLVRSGITSKETPIAYTNSVASFGNKNQATYAASKAAFTSFVESVNSEGWNFLSLVLPLIKDSGMYNNLLQQLNGNIKLVERGARNKGGIITLNDAIHPLYNHITGENPDQETRGTYIVEPDGGLTKANFSLDHIFSPKINRDYDYGINN